VDMMELVDVPSGHGHDYTVNYLDAWAQVVQPAGWTPEKAEQPPSGPVDFNAIVAEFERLQGDLVTDAELARVRAKLDADFSRQIASNAGEEGAVIVEKLKGYKDINMGFNAANGKFEDLLKAGIIDPAKVVRSAVQNASSIAALLLTTECIITDIKEPEPPAPMPNPGMGGMY